jgi:hypothetical protein
MRSLPSPPSGGEDPLRIRVQEPPQADHARENHQPKKLIPPKCAGLPLARLALGDLLLIRLDAGFNHVKPLCKSATHKYRFGRPTYVALIPDLC